jgi:uncharacterized protein
MSPRAANPRRLDVAALAAAGATLDGSAGLADFPRLADGAPAGLDAPVTWAARFEQRRTPGVGLVPWLHLRAQARVARECQRCLQPVVLALEIDRAFRFAPDEATAAAQDADSEDDVLAASATFDLPALVEDELLLALPLVPKHDDCTLPLAGTAAPGGPEPVDEPDEHPFAGLAALRREPRH